MKVTQIRKFESQYVVINDVALKKDDISSFCYAVDCTQIQIIMKSGDEHLFEFEEVNAFNAVFRELVIGNI